MALRVKRNIWQLVATATIGVAAGIFAVAFHQAMVWLAVRID